MKKVFLYIAIFTKQYNVSNVFCTYLLKLGMLFSNQTIFGLVQIIVK